MVSSDTIQLLLKQRQELRESLMELRREIASLDASSRSLVEKTIPKQAAAIDSVGAQPAAAASASPPSQAGTPPLFPPPPHPTGEPVPPATAEVFPAVTPRQKDGAAVTTEAAGEESARPPAPEPVAVAVPPAAADADVTEASASQGMEESTAVPAVPQEAMEESAKVATDAAPAPPPEPAPVAASSVEAAPSRR